MHEDAGGNLVRSGLQKRSSPVRACRKPSPGTSRPTLQARATKGAIGRACGGSPPVPNEPLPATVCGGLARWKRVNRFWQLLPSSPFFPRQMTSTCNTATFHTEVRLQHPVQQGDLFPRSGLAVPALVRIAGAVPTGRQMPRLASGCRGFPAAPIRNTNFIQLGNPRGAVRWRVSFCAWFWFSRKAWPCRQTPRASGTRQYLTHRRLALSPRRQSTTSSCSLLLV